MKIIVTGSNGILGYHLVKYFDEQEHEVIGISLQPDSRYKSAKFTYHCMDMSAKNSDLLTILNEADVLIHTAHIMPNTCDLLATSQNINMGGNIFDAYVNSTCKNIIFISSASVYTENIHQIDYSKPQEEDDFKTCSIAYSRSIYATEKKLLEYLLTQKALIENKPYLILRPTNIYGKYIEKHKEQFIPTMIQHVKKGNSVKLTNGNAQSKNFVYAKDIAIACQKLLEYKVTNSTFNICTTQNSSLIMVINLIADILDKKAIIHNTIDKQAIHLTYSNSKLLKAIKWVPDTTDIAKNLKSIIDDSIQNEW